MNTKNTILNRIASIVALGAISIVSIQNCMVTPQESYGKFIENHPFYRALQNNGNETGTGAEAKAECPNLAWEQDFLLTMDPQLGRPAPERLIPIIAQLKAYAQMKKLPGDLLSPWVERGPNNVGGRTRTLVWDPNDSLQQKVWAGSVGGGLWYNNNISDSNSAWISVNDFMENISISCLSFDPNNSQIAYLGTGEGWNQSYSGAKGAGIWKTTDAGKTWSHLASSDSFYYINDIVVRNENDTSVIYAAVDGSHSYGIYLGQNYAGLQRSIDGGLSWTEVLPFSWIAADIEIDSANRLWIGTKAFPQSGGTGGGKVLRSENGINWTTMYSVSTSAGTGRVELACAPADANVIYAAIESSNKINRIVRSSDSGSTWTNLALPDDADSGIPANDFTRSQAWYDLIMAVDPNNKDIVLIGGVDLFLSKNGGTSWGQISKWANSGGLGALPCSYVHADQHAIAFKRGYSNTVIFGNDGGVFYTTDIDSAVTKNKIQARNHNYNVTQFYSCAIHPDANNNFYLAGAQDNGTQRFTQPGLGSTGKAYGGDGAYCFIDQNDPDYQIVSYTYNNYYLSTNSGDTFANKIVSSPYGSFINPADYDDQLNILYSCYSSSALMRTSNITTSPSTGQTITIAGMNGIATHIRVSPYTTSSSTLFIGTSNGNILKVTQADGSPVSVKISGTNLPKGSVSCIEIGNNENELLATFYNYGIPSVWYTNDGGTNWVSKEGNLPDMPVRWALFNPDNKNQAILATELGVWACSNLSDSLPAWVPSNAGMGNVRVDMFQIRASDRQVIATTHGRGLYSNDGFKWPTGSKEKEKGKETAFKLYPNPTNGEFTLEFYHESSKVFYIDIFDMQGKSAYKKSVPSNITGQNIIRLEANTLSSGTYLLRLTDDNKYYKFKKILIQ